MSYSTENAKKALEHQVLVLIITQSYDLQAQGNAQSLSVNCVIGITNQYKTNKENVII